MLFEWQRVRKVIHRPNHQALQIGITNWVKPGITNWVKPDAGRYKCNIDATFSNHHNKVGINMCIRDEMSAFVLERVCFGFSASRITSINLKSENLSFQWCLV